MTFISCTLVSLYYPSLRAKGPLPNILSFHPRQLIMSGFTCLWASRLGSFLYQVRSSSRDNVAVGEELIQLIHSESNGLDPTRVSTRLRQSQHPSPERGSCRVSGSRSQRSRFTPSVGPPVIVTSRMLIMTSTSGKRDSGGVAATPRTSRRTRGRALGRSVRVRGDRRPTEECLEGEEE